MRVKVSLYIAGKVHDEVVSAISYEEAKRTALARNPSGRVITGIPVPWSVAVPTLHCLEM